MRKVPSRTRRNLVIAGVAGAAALAAPAVVTRSIVRPAHAAVTEVAERIKKHAIPGKETQLAVVRIPIEIPNRSPGWHKNSRVKNVRLNLDIEHREFSSLEFLLTSPDGHTIRLWGHWGRWPQRQEYHGLGMWNYEESIDAYGKKKNIPLYDEGMLPCAYGAHLTLDDDFPTRLTEEHCRTNEWVGGPGETGHFNTGKRLASFRGRAPHHGTWHLTIRNHVSERAGWLHRGELQVWSEADE